MAGAAEGPVGRSRKLENLGLRSPGTRQEFWSETLEILDASLRKMSFGAKILTTDVLGVSRVLKFRLKDIRGRMGQAMQN